MLGAIKLPSSGVSQNKFFNGRYPMSRLLGPTIWKFVMQSNHNGAEINKVQVFTLIKYYGMVQESSTYGLKTASTVLKNLFMLNEHHLLIFCKGVTIIRYQAGNQSKSQSATSKHFADAKVHSSIP